MKLEKVWPKDGGLETLEKSYFIPLSYRETLKNFTWRCEEGLEAGEMETQRPVRVLCSD